MGVPLALYGCGKATPSHRETLAVPNPTQIAAPRPDLQPNPDAPAAVALPSADYLVLLRDLERQADTMIATLDGEAPSYCKGCRYRPDLTVGSRACPVTTLYWAFLERHEEELASNPRTALMVKNLY